MICRLCLHSSNDGQSIFQDNIARFLTFLELPAKKDDHFPKIICNTCAKQIEGILLYIRRCKEANDQLAKILRNKEFEDINDNVSDMFHELKTEVCEVTDVKPDKKHIQKTTLLEDDRTVNIFCKNCKKLFKNKSTLGKHYVQQQKCRPHTFRIHKCEVCNKEYGTQRQKAEHMNIHSGKTPYVCTYCGKKFKFHSKLYIHIYRHKLALGLVTKKDCYTEKRVRLNLSCDECGKTYASRSGYEKHLRKHNGRLISHKKNGPTTIDKSNKIYLCDYCGKSFYIKANLDNHLRVHTGEKPFTCNNCGKKFIQKGSLDRHALNHLDRRPKPHQCDVCLKFFTTKAYMEVHKRLHSGKKPYECIYCRKCFNYRSHWKIHLRIHTGESPYLCEVCNNGYHDRGSLKKHQNKKGHQVPVNVKNDSSANSDLTNTIAVSQ
ncbi:zinc finger protein 33B-like isoform X2 [Cylas formicarius]|uniref:zinc finger protein 33B-like isoform X2 n=1 Tax=Cylas formicarius TaxID=197179 RepID=UPI002958C0A3|nr:zinc finger protein 33B-like isoform X2 [Cylas formicarius]